MTWILPNLPQDLQAALDNFPPFPVPGRGRGRGRGYVPSPLLGVFLLKKMRGRSRHMNTHSDGLQA